MDDAIQRAREAREVAADFFAANPGQQYLCLDGAVYQPGGQVIPQPAEGSVQQPELPMVTKGSKT